MTGYAGNQPLLDPKGQPLALRPQIVLCLQQKPPGFILRILDHGEGGTGRRHERNAAGEPVQRILMASTTLVQMGHGDHRNAQPVCHVRERFKHFPRFGVPVAICTAHIGRNWVDNYQADVTNLTGPFFQQCNVRL